MHAGRFGPRARAYAAARPVHPPEAVAYVFAGIADVARTHVADLGAGTGLSARMFADAGARVSAIEPNDAMRAAARPHPRVASIGAPAERATLPAASVDVVTACSAWHWFDHDAVVPEIERILTPRGRLALFETRLDEADAFTRAYRDLFRRFETSAERMPDNLDRAVAINPAGAERAQFAYAQVLDRAGLHAYADSHTLAPDAGAAYDAFHAAIDALIAGSGDPANVVLRRISNVLRVDR